MLVHCAASNAAENPQGLNITPVKLSSLVLKKLVKDVEPLIGKVTRAVITVPANFTNEARLSTIEAGRLAGLEVTDIVNEPTAALLYYSLQRPVSGTVVVYDFGGGTLDVTIARVKGNNIEIVTSRGDPRLGGIDFDSRLLGLITEKYSAQTGEAFDKNVHTLGKTPEEYKQQLSVRNETSVQVAGGASGRVILKIGREEFERAAATLISKADLLVDTALEDAKIRARDVTNIYLVGGTTRMPMVRQHLKTLFGKDPVCYVNPDEVVALGAALYAGLKASDSSLNPAQVSAVRGIQLQEVANHFFGTISLANDPASGRKILRNSVILKKNQPLPCSTTESYYTVHEGQTSVNCRVTQSATLEVDPDFVRVIWDGELGPLPPGRPESMEIRVTYGYDANQVMHCVFEDVASGLKREVELGIKVASDDREDAGIERFLVD